MVEIDFWVTSEFNGAWPTPHAVLPQQLHSAVESLAGRLVLVVKVTPKQNKVHLSRNRNPRESLKI